MWLVAILALGVVAAGGSYYLRGRQSALSRPLSPLHAILQAASRSLALESMSGTFTTQVNGLTVLTGTVSEQLRPARLASMKITTVDGAVRFSIDEIVTDTQVYVGIPAYATASGKPWLGVPVAGLTADSAMTELYATSAIPSSEASLVSEASRARRVGTERIGGVQTSRYVGTIDAAAALPSLDSALRQLLAPELTASSGMVGFVAWIDSHNDFREIQSTIKADGSSTVTTVVFAARDPAVHITVPAASQVATVPVSGLPAGLTG